jgi:hypothetical protein
MHVEANIHLRANILFTISHTGENLLQVIRFEANIHKPLCKFHIQANICILANIRYVLLRPQLMFSSF